MITDAHVVKFAPLPAEYAAEDKPRGHHEFTVRAHVLTEIRRNARRWLLGYQSPESKSKDYGDVLDCLTLTPTQWPRRYAITPETYTNKDGKTVKWRNDTRVAEVAAWHEKHAGLTIVDATLNGKVHAAIKRLQEDERIASFLASGDNQCWIAGHYTDGATGITVPTKCLIDIVPNPEHPVFGQCLGDLKSTRNASPRTFGRDAFQYGYHIAAAWYLDHWKAATGEERTDFVHVVQENFPPYECRLPFLSQRFIGLGRAMYQDALAMYCRCLATGFWPSYDGTEGFPITDCEDWMCDLKQVYSELEEPEEGELETETEEVIP